MGLSECTGEELRRAHAVHPLSAVQLEWSLQTRDAARDACAGPQGCSISDSFEDIDVFNATANSCLSFKTAGCPAYNTTYAAAFHTYKIVWTPTWIAWMIDTTLYRNSTNVPWRPVNVRPLLRTNVGTAASVAALPDSTVYIKRLRYTPLTWAGSANVLADALLNPSFYSVYGTLAGG